MDLKNFKGKYEVKQVKENLNYVNQNPLVSVCVQTYEHVNYIKQCLDGILFQKTNFEFEILLGEDDSTDGTRELCVDYAKRYPDKIRLFLHHRENNIKIGGQPTGRFNFLYNLHSSKGKYIALCEGDDYWTDPLKLQKQVDFLEGNPEYSLCFHRVQILENGALLSDEKDFTNITYCNISNNEKEKINYEHLITRGNFIHTPSVVYRKPKEYPLESLYSPLGDYLLHIYNGKQGYIKRLEDVMAVYRKGVGIFSSIPKHRRYRFSTFTYISILSLLDDNDEKMKTLLLKKINRKLNTIYKYYEKPTFKYLVSNLYDKIIFKFFK
jgi:glycosyltransferase involved in cell wall biosynthesis